MKKNLTFLMLMLSALVSFTACSSDDDTASGKDAGSENKTDVAVTGAVQEVGVTYAVLTGYVNLNMIPAGTSSYKMGFQIGRTNDDYNPNGSDWGGKKYVDNVVGNKITISHKGLAAAHEWRFRTFVYADGHYYFGETKTFETKDFENITKIENVNEITSSSATVTCLVDTLRAFWMHDELDYKASPRVGVAWSKDSESLTDHILNDYEEGRPYQYTTVQLQSVEENTYKCKLSNLEPNTTYYYCSFTYMGDTYRGGVLRSFTTSKK